MKKFLVFWGILVITIPLLLILQPVFGWNLVTWKEYLFVVFSFVGLIILYDKDKKNKGGKDGTTG